MSGAVVWNSVPADLPVSSPTVATIARHLDAYLFSRLNSFSAVRLLALDLASSSCFERCCLDTPWTAPSKTTDRLSLSSTSELVSVQSDSGRADPRTMITWPGAEVAQWLFLLLTNCMFMLKNRDSLSASHQRKYTDKPSQ